MSTSASSAVAQVPSPVPETRLSRRALLFRTIVGLLLLLGLVRLLLPWLLARAINDRLGSLPAHHGVVGDVDLQLFRGAYRLHNVSIRQRGEDGEPLVSVRTVDFSLAWRELFRGRVVSDIVLDAPILRLTRNADPPAPEPAPGEEPPPTVNNPGWRDLIQDLFPITITRLAVRDGTFDYADTARERPFEIGLAAVRAEIEGLANRTPRGDRSAPAVGELTGTLQGGGDLVVRARGFPLADPPVFEAEAELDRVPLPAINSVLRSALGVDVSAGSLRVDAEIRAAGGGYEGYVKPLVRGARFTDLGDEPDSGPLKSLWETLVSGATALLTNDDTKNVGTRVPFSGRFGRTEVSSWEAFVALLRNAFVRALREGTDQSIVDA